MTTQMDKQPTTDYQLPLKLDKEDWLKSKIRDIVDFPKPGIVFKDITPLIKAPEQFHFTLHALAQHSAKLRPDVVAGIEARGFILAPAIADILGIGFVPIRKPGKLPFKVERVSYALEYGTDTIEVHVDAVDKGQRVLIIDDLLATGGTAQGAGELIKKVGGNLVGYGFVVELGFLGGRAKLDDNAEVFSLISYS
ncbi:MAG: adenine phosphoribosyltransferase [Candidatus Obscuribacterales bacterium]|nr:adenine phosphoribosyltransferase [Candidatus Obscuribacterales bacterium]